MFRHTLLQIFRSFLRLKSSFLINVAGLSTGLACALFIYLWVMDEVRFDRFHEKTDRLYQVMETQQLSDEARVKYRTSGLVAETLKQEFPEIEYSTAVIQSSWFPEFVLSHDDSRAVKAVGQVASTDYFDLFSFAVIEGEGATALETPESIAISDVLARKIFNTTDNLVGKSISLRILGLSKQLTVSAVFKAVPQNSSEKFDFLVSFEWWKQIVPAVVDWGNDGTNAYVVVRHGTDIDALNAKIAGVVKSKMPGSTRDLFLKPYGDVYLRGKYENGVQAGGRIEYVRLFTIIAVFVLVIACINFMNLATARATVRIREAGIKKAIGASRRSLIAQFLGESMAMSFLSLGIALLLVQLLLPQFNLLTGKQLLLQPTPDIALPCIGIAVVAGLLAGSYPAFHLSGFNPANVLKGKIALPASALLIRKGLVVFQFAVSVILIVAVVVVYRQIAFIQSQNLGYDKDNVIRFDREGRLIESRETFLEALRNVPGVKNASAMWGNLVGGYSTTGGLDWEGKPKDDQTSFEIMEVDYGLMEMMNIGLASGRAFSKDFPADTSKIIFNEAAIEAMGLSDPVGKTVSLWGMRHEIIGIARNFHFQSLHENIKPLFIRLQPERTSMMLAKIERGREVEALKGIEKLYKSYNPGLSFDYAFLDQQFQAQYAAEHRVSLLSQYFAGITILISCLGLFGLAAFTAERRTKEIGIRKVLGASESGILLLITREFAVVVLVGIVLALPVSYFALHAWLEGFAYKINLEAWHFIAAGAAALAIATITVGAQALRASKVNPINCLRAE